MVYNPSHQDVEQRLAEAAQASTAPAAPKSVRRSKPATGDVAPASLPGLGLGAAGALGNIGVSAGQRGPSILGTLPPDPDKQRAPSLVEYGASGVAVIAGIIQHEEYNDQLSWKQGVRVYDKMRRSDATVRQSLAVVSQPLRSATWKVAPASPDPAHVEHASFADTCLFHDLEGQDWDAVLQQILIFLWAGFSVLEKVFKVEDGMVKWQKLAPRLPKTIQRWWEGPDRELMAVQQWMWNATIQNYSYVNIRANQVLLFSHDREGNNYEGISLLRAAYQSWWTKSAYIKLQAVGLEREHVGIPTISLPEGYTAGDVKRANQIGKNIRSNEQGFITLPPGWGVEWLKSKSPEKRGGGIQDAIRYCDLQILSNVLAAFLNLGQSGTGSYAMSSDLSTFFLKSLQGYAKQICGVFNRDAFPQLLRYNYGPLDMYPTLLAQSIQTYSVKELSAAIHDLVLSGAMRPTVEIEDFLYEVLGIPRPPANLVESTSPNGPNGARLKPDATGVTPLPMTPEEEMAAASKYARDIQRVSTQTPGGIGGSNDKQATPTVDSKPSRPKPAPSAPDGQMHEVYQAYLSERMTGRRPMSATQAAVYRRMASEQALPRIQLYGDYRFASARPARSAQQEYRLQRRRDIVGDLASEVRQGFEAFREEMKDLIHEEGTNGGNAD